MLFHTPFSHDFLLPLLFGTPLLVLGLIPKALVILEWRNLQMMTTGQCYTGTAFQQMFYTGNFISNPWKHSVAGLIIVLILKWRNLGFKRLRTWPYLCNWIWKCWISNWDRVTTKYLLFLLSGPSSVKPSVTLSSPPLFSLQNLHWTDCFFVSSSYSAMPHVHITFPATWENEQGDDSY